MVTEVAINNLNKTYKSSEDIVVLKDININIYKNEYISIIGPSGCGKSTILNIIAGLDKHYIGTIKFNKKNIKVGYMLQEDALFDWLNVLDNALIGLKIQKKLTKENKDYVISLLKKYGLKDFMYKYPKSLSGGMRQRVLRIQYRHK